MLDIHIRYCCYESEPSASILEYAHSVLDDAERARLERFKVNGPAKQFLLGRYLAKTMLAEKIGCEAQAVHIALSENGKPYVTDINRGFSISHCNNMVMVAVANTPIGIDVEQTQRFEDGKAINSHFFSDAVVDDLKQKNSPFNNVSLPAQYWTAMEAIVKLEDTSIFSERKQFSFIADAEGNYPTLRNITLLSWPAEQQTMASIALPATENEEIVLQYESISDEGITTLNFNASAANMKL